MVSWGCDPGQSEANLLAWELISKSILIKLRERKVFNVKGHNSPKLKVNVIFGSLCSGIYRRVSALSAVKSPFLTHSSVAMWLASQEQTGETFLKHTQKNTQDVLWSPHQPTVSRYRPGKQGTISPKKCSDPNGLLESIKSS